MDKIVEIMDDISMNIEEAQDKIEKAYRLKDHCPQYAEWQAGMAATHLSFNSKGIETMERMLERAEKHEHDEFFRMWKTYAMKKTARVKAMIEAYQK